MGIPLPVPALILATPLAMPVSAVRAQSGPDGGLTDAIEHIGAAPHPRLYWNALTVMM